MNYHYYWIDKWLDIFDLCVELLQLNILIESYMLGYNFIDLVTCYWIFNHIFKHIHTCQSRSLSAVFLYVYPQSFNWRKWKENQCIFSCSRTWTYIMHYINIMQILLFWYFLYAFYTTLTISVKNYILK